jgi:hypothetical protein
LTDVYEAACEEIDETGEVLADLDRRIEELNDYRKESVVLQKTVPAKRIEISNKLFISLVIRYLIYMSCLPPPQFPLRLPTPKPLHY